MTKVGVHTELHRHLDASFRPGTLAEMIRRFNIPVPYQTEQAVREDFWLTKPMKSLKEVLDRFELFQKVLGHKEVLERLARETVEDAFRENIRAVELRYSPTFTSEYSGISWAEALAAFERGIQAGVAATGIKAGLICIMSRGFGEALAHQTMEFAIEHKSHFVGVDLAGLEEGYPCRTYKHLFRMATDAGLPITVHAGEACGPENVWEAIDELGASRIGHGIHSIEDPVLVKRLAKDQIMLEMCPTSNWITASVIELSKHPLPLFLDAGVPCSINTDDPGIFGVGLPEEFERCRKFLNMSENDLTRIDEYAAEHSFL